MGVAKTPVNILGNWLIICSVINEVCVCVVCELKELLAYRTPVHKQGRIIHCAGCTMGGAPAASPLPRSTAILPRCVDVR